MKAISLLQPYAGLLAWGMKQNETRSWATKYRGTIAIHSSARIPKQGWDLIKLLQLQFPDRFSEGMQGLKIITTTGCILGQVDIVDTFSTNGPLPDDIWEQQFGDYSADRHYWKCENPIVYNEFIPAKGQLSIWKVDSDTICMIELMKDFPKMRDFGWNV